jgi:predicted nucleic acid-binding protein
MRFLIKILHRVAKHPRGLLDTSVLIDFEKIALNLLPDEIAIAALSLAELAAGPHATDNANERAERQERLQRIETSWLPVPFDTNAARAYGRIYAAVRSSGRKPRGRRAVDLLIAATALSENLPLYTRNPEDFQGLEDLLEIVAV